MTKQSERLIQEVAKKQVVIGNLNLQVTASLYVLSFLTPN